MAGLPTLAITGSTGELGGRVARVLAGRGVPQRLIVRDTTRAPRLDGAEPVVASGYDDRDAMREAMAGAHTLYFVSGREDPDRLEQHRNVVAAAKEAGVARIVYVSFLAAAEDATFTLARHHWATERAIEDAGIAHTFLRSSLYLDFMPFFAGAEGVIRGPAGKGRFGPVARDDLAASAGAVLAAADEAGTSSSPHDGRTYELTGPELVDLAEVAFRLEAASDKSVRYVPETIEQAWESRRETGAPDWEIEGWISSYLAIGDGSLEKLTRDVTELTGSPPQDLEACLAAHPELLAPLAG